MMAGTATNFGTMPTSKNITNLFDDREISGLKGTDKLKLIVKI
jgi:hypothetical protein